MKTVKKISLSLLTVLMAISFTCFIGCAKSNNKSNKVSVQADLGLSDISCNVGESFILPIPKSDAYILSYDIEVKDGNTTIAILSEDDGGYTFETAGEYSVVYNAETDTQILVDDFTVSVSAGGAFAIDWLPETAGRFDTVELVDVYKNINGELLKANVVVTSPSGKTIDTTNKSVEFNEEGNWTFEFSAGEGDSKVTETKTVAVSLNSSDLFSFTSGGVKKTDNSTTLEGMGAKDKPLIANGLEMTFKGDGVIRFNNIIDLNNLSSSESLIELYAIPASVPDYTGYTEEKLPGETYPSGGYTHGTANFTKFEIRLTDIYDSSNVVIITFFYMPTYSYWNWTEGFINIGDEDKCYAINEGKLGVAQYGANNVGAVGSYSFYGEGNLPFNVQIDYATKCFYSNLRGAGQVLVLDYSDSSRLGAANVWKGFTTGECYMELSFPTVSKDSSILITEVLGVSLADTKPADSEGPQITIDKSNFEDGITPTAKVGTAYKVPSATAFDKISGECSVLYNVKNASGETVNIENGAFVPSAVGNYIITYTAKDFYGNDSELTLTVIAAETLSNIVITPKESYEFFAGIDALKPEFEVTGGSGKKQLAISYYLNDKEIKDNEGWLSFSESGTLKVKFTITDYLGTREETVSYMVATQNKPIISDVVLPYALYVGQEYVFPKAEAYDYKNNKSVDVNISVNGTYLKTNRKYTPKESDGDTLYVTYSALANGELETKTYTTKVIAYNIFSHMTIDGMVNTEVSGRYTQITSSSDFTISFAYPVSDSQLKFALGGVSEKDNFSSIKITAKDAGDSKKAITAEIKKGTSGKWTVVIGSASYSASFDWVNTSNENAESIIASIMDGNLKLTNANNVLIDNFPIEKWDNGTSFSGFTSGGAYLTIKFAGVDGETSVKLFGFANQTYAKSSSMSEPTTSLLGDLSSGVVELNTIIEIPKAVGFSVISYDVSVSFIVTDKNGNTVLSGDGKVGGSFTCDALGMYICTFTAIDNVNGISSEVQYYFEVRDVESPTVAIDSNLGKAKLNKDFKIKSATVTDDNGAANCTVKVFVIDLNYNSHDVTDTMKYNATETGRYKVVYMAMDEAGNIGIATSYFTVQ